MNALLGVFLIGAISQLIFFKIINELLSDPDIKKFLRVVMSTVIIYGVYTYLSKGAKLTRLLIEAGVVGILTLIIGKISTHIVVDYIRLSNLDTEYSTEIIFITTGVLIHLFCEFTGLNKWYITNGVAAM
jgi:hypothetical protein